MPIQTNNIDLVLQYALLVAGEEDDYRDRQLGPIHLIKYAYLADLEYAKNNAGKTFTGVNWKFYHFGPWEQAVNERIDIALAAIAATKHSFSSDYGDKDEWFRWDLRDESRLAEIKSKLPLSITAPLKRHINNFSGHTQSLLAFVYNTPPMLSVAPNERLDFLLVAKPEVPASHVEEALRFSALSNKKAKKFSEKMKELRTNKNNVALAEKTLLIDPVKNPRYDEIYFSGLDWLDHTSGIPLVEGMLTAHFSPDVWKSSTRTGEDDVS